MDCLRAEQVHAQGRAARGNAALETAWCRVEASLGLIGAPATPRDAARTPSEVAPLVRSADDSAPGSGYVPTMTSPDLRLRNVARAPAAATASNP